MENRLSLRILNTRCKGKGTDYLALDKRATFYFTIGKEFQHGIKAGSIFPAHCKTLNLMGKIKLVEFHKLCFSLI